MDNNTGFPDRDLQLEEKRPKAGNGMLFMLLIIFLIAASVVGIIVSSIMLEAGENKFIAILILIISILYSTTVGPIMLMGLKIIKPNEALVLTLFGKYYGTIQGAGFYYVNPFVTAVNPTYVPPIVTTTTGQQATTATISTRPHNNKRISMKAMTLCNDKQKINDQLGNPIIIGIVVIWRVVNTAKAVFNVDNFEEYLSTQCDSSLRRIVRLYPYDVSGDDNEKTLRGSSQEIAEKLKNEIQSKVDIAGLEIMEASITHLSYAPEIAAAMLQRQQASAIIDARQMIVEGAVGMVEMALAKLNQNNIVVLDEERKATMVSNLLVVLCGNRDVQPVVNSGSIY